MTDEQIEKALDSLIETNQCVMHDDGNDCDECPLNNISACNFLVVHHIQKVKQLAENRLKAEKEQIRKETAKEIYNLIDFFPIPNRHGTHLRIGFENALSAIKLKISKKYGVEIDV